MWTYDIHALDVSTHLVGSIVHFSDHLQFAFGVKIKRWAFRLHINFKTHYVHHRTWVSFKRRELLTLRELIVSAPVFGGIRVALLLSFLCCVMFFYVLFVFVLCLVCQMLPMSLDCLFLIAPLVFFDVYLHTWPYLKMCQWSSDLILTLYRLWLGARSFTIFSNGHRKWSPLVVIATNRFVL